MVIDIAKSLEYRRVKYLLVKSVGYRNRGVKYLLVNALCGKKMHTVTKQYNE